MELQMQRNLMNNLHFSNGDGEFLINPFLIEDDQFDVRALSRVQGFKIKYENRSGAVVGDGLSLDYDVEIEAHLEFLCIFTFYIPNFEDNEVTVSKNNIVHVDIRPTRITVLGEKDVYKPLHLSLEEFKDAFEKYEGTPKEIWDYSDYLDKYLLNDDILVNALKESIELNTFTIVNE